MTGTVATGLAGADIAGQVHAGQYLNASLSTLDFAWGLGAARAGPIPLLVDTVFNALVAQRRLQKVLRSKFVP